MAEITVNDNALARSEAITTERPRAFSYVRFSTPEQAKGDSLRRQTEKTRAYVEAHGLALDTTLTAKMIDRGVSAHHGRNVMKGGLGVFLDAVRDGLVPRGSFLIVESLDRISRETVHRAAATLQMIVALGINVVDLEDGDRVYSDATFEADQTAFLIMAIRFMRSNMESRLKGERVALRYEEKRKAAAQGDKSKPFTRALPGWLAWSKETGDFVAIPDRARVIQDIYTMAASGMGQQLIAQRLNANGEPTFERRGGQQRADAWHRSYVQRLLTNSAVVGTFTPQLRGKDKRKPVPQDPILNYFPAIIDRELFERVANRARATAPRGRHATVETKSVFAGLSKCVQCGGPFTRMQKSASNVYLICSRANRRLGCSRLQAVRYDDVEQALRENARTTIEDAPRGLATEEIEAQIVGLEVTVDELADAARELADELVRERHNGARDALRDQLRKKGQEHEAARKRLRALRTRRDTMAKGYVIRRLQAVEQTLTQEPFRVVEANRALKEAASKVVINPETGSLLIYWHHAPEQPTEAGPFHSKHNNTFDEVPGGYVHKRAKRAKGNATEENNNVD